MIRQFGLTDFFNRIGRFLPFDQRQLGLWIQPVATGSYCQKRASRRRLKAKGRFKLLDERPEVGASEA